MTIRRYEISDFEWAIILPLLPNKPRGVARVDDRKVLNGIYWRLRAGAPWADIPERYGPYTTCYNRFVRWRKLGVWDAIFDAVSKAYEGNDLSRLPRIRSTGEVETFRGWNRMQYGFGAVKEYHGGWHFTSLQDPKVAPPGKHLVGMSMGHQDRFETWAQAKYDIDAAVAYMHNFYLDLEACVEWSHYQWVDPPQVQSWAFKPVMGHPVKISTIEGLYCASSSAETATDPANVRLFSGSEGAAAAVALDLVMQEYGGFFAALNDHALAERGTIDNDYNAKRIKGEN